MCLYVSECWILNDKTHQKNGGAGNASRIAMRVRDPVMADVNGTAQVTVTAWNVEKECLKTAFWNLGLVCQCKARCSIGERRRKCNTCGVISVA